MLGTKGISGKLGVIAAILLTVLTAMPGLAADKYPSRPINLVVAWGPGGRADILARMLAPLFEKMLGQPVIVVNKPGGGGYIGYKAAAAAKPDGYTIGLPGSTLLTLQYMGEGKIRWEEFKWIGQCFTASYTVCVNAQAPWNTVEELIDYGRKNPSKLRHGVGAYGSGGHLALEGLGRAAGIKFTQISYKGGDAQMGMGLASNEVDVANGPLAGFRPLIEAGKIKVLAVQGEQRIPTLPNIPTLREKGINWSLSTFKGMTIPRDTPEEITLLLENTLAKAMKDPALLQSLKKLDLVAEYKNRKEFTAYVAEQDKKYHDLLKEVGLIKK